MSYFNTKDTYKESFEEYCKNNNLEDLLSLWDNELNDEIPSKVAAHCSRRKFWFKCPNGIHESHLISLNSLCRSLNIAKKMDVCPACRSIGQFIIDNYGKEYLDTIWSNKNKLSYYDISRGSTKKKIWLKCLNDNTHPDYDIMPGNFAKTHNCPYCAGKRVCFSNSLGFKYPQVLKKWSDKNTHSPFDYTPSSKQKVWLKCENHKHDDYQQTICNASGLYSFQCPECGREKQHVRRGSEHPNWKGGITPTIKKIRKSQEYNEWRKSIYEFDKYTCQCCLNKNNSMLRAHHILSFSSHNNLRFDFLNGITLCDQCHDPVCPGSFHNIYGTHDKTRIELQEYINNKRKQLGIIIPFNIEHYLNTKIRYKVDNWLDFLTLDKEDENFVEFLNYKGGIKNG